MRRNHEKLTILDQLTNYSKRSQDSYPYQQVVNLFYCFHSLCAVVHGSVKGCSSTQDMLEDVPITKTDGGTALFPRKLRDVRMHTRTTPD